MFENILKNIREKSPIVHCITNYVTVNDVANTILASGASPIMADDVEEVEDIVSISNSLVLNIGTLNSRTIDSMIKAGKMANKIKIPVVLDPVGMGASKLRTETTLKLLKEVKFFVIRGNASEIKSLVHGSRTSSGVDVSVEDIIDESNIVDYIEITKELKRIYNGVIAVTGPIDIVTNGEKTYIIRNGQENMERVTGTGCMLSGLIGGFVGGNPDSILDSTAAAIATMGLCGEMANERIMREDLGTGSLRTYLIDYISKIDGKILSGGIKIESR